MGKTAVLVDGRFFLIYARKPLGGSPDAAALADAVERLAAAHLAASGRDPRALYRIFFYDCPPLEKRLPKPVSRVSLDFSKTPQAEATRRLHAELRTRRKVALRLGQLDERNTPWVVREDRLRGLLPRKPGAGPPENRSVDLRGLTDDDFTLAARQKGVDMRVGLDIAALAFKRQVDQIVLVAGDSDFVPAAKLARREGIDFLLDPLGNGIRADLNEHVDGVRSVKFSP